MHNIWWNSKSGSYVVNKLSSVEEVEKDVNQIGYWSFVSTLQSQTLEGIVDDFWTITQNHRKIMCDIMH